MKRLVSTFGAKIDRECPLAEYPRPDMRREDYTMLNGIWQYAIRDHIEEHIDEYDGEILVPFSPESGLSGVNRCVLPSDVLYYRREFDYSHVANGERVLLHFDAVDYEAETFVNGVRMGSHRGGYLPFTYDITDVLLEHNVLELRVTDPSDTESQSRGKQSLKSSGIFYTANTGIWQSVWLERVPVAHIEALKITTDIDTRTIDIEITSTEPIKAGHVTIRLRDEIVAESDYTGSHVSLVLDSIELWSPEHPILYDIELRADADRVTSYTAMREVDIREDRHGIKRTFLNGEPYFMNGVLDQGYWSDSLLTPPSDEAMIYDIMTMKEMGFNMLRKHIKIEPARWYYHADRLGMLVWQDFVSGGRKPNVAKMSMLGNFHARIRDDRYKFFGREDAVGRAEFLAEIEPTILLLMNHPSIVEWTPFNEGWGQFDALEVESLVRSIDETRLIDHASGWMDEGGGDFRSLHVYFMPIHLPRDERCLAVTEFGGYSLAVDGHISIEKRAFGYKSIKDRTKYRDSLARLYRRDIERNIAKGLSVAIYTQLSDVENEVNGLITYDRAVEKISREDIRAINEAVYREFDRVTR